MAKYTPSMMCCNLLNVEKDIKEIDKHSDFYHIDIMDGNYVPNLTLSFDFIKAIKPIVTKPIDAHLMVKNPLDFIELAEKAGADMLTFHPDTIHKAAFRTINLVKSKGMKVGVALLPSQGIDAIKEYIHLLDKVTVMTVDPGFAGQPVILEMTNKMKELSKYKKENKLNYIIEVDGSCNYKTFEKYLSNGAEMFVLGSGLFNASNLDEEYKKIKKFVSDIEEKL